MTDLSGFYKLWKSLAFRGRLFCVQIKGRIVKNAYSQISAAFSGKGMSTTPLGLIQNVRLPGREGLWQIAIEQGRFGGITPMGDTEDENVRILNARGGLAIPRL